MSWIFAIFSIVCGFISLRVAFGWFHFFHDWKYSHPKKLKLLRSYLGAGGVEKVSNDVMIFKKRKCKYCGKVEFNLYDIKTDKDNWQECSAKTMTEYWNKAYEVRE